MARHVSDIHVIEGPAGMEILLNQQTGALGKGLSDFPCAVNQPPSTGRKRAQEGALGQLLCVRAFASASRSGVTVSTPENWSFPTCLLSGRGNIVCLCLLWCRGGAGGRGHLSHREWTQCKSAIETLLHVSASLRSHFLPTRAQLHPATWPHSFTVRRTFF